MNERRRESVGRLIREVASEVLRDEMRDPRVRLATITSVEVNADLRHAKAMVSISALDEAECEECFRAIESARGFLRRAIAEKVRLRFMPELTFVRDRGAERAARIQTVLREIASDEPTPPAPPTAEVPGETP